MTLTIPKKACAIQDLIVLAKQLPKADAGAETSAVFAALADSAYSLANNPGGDTGGFKAKKTLELISALFGVAAALDVPIEARIRLTTAAIVSDFYRYKG
jgi:hypothetical protein